MHIDRLLHRTLARTLTKSVGRLAQTGLAGLRQRDAGETPKSPAAARPDETELRGSGSWANDWAGARGAIERAKSLALPKRTEGTRKKATRQKSRVLPQSLSIPEDTIHIKPLMAKMDARLYAWIADRMETETPTCTLHAGVALQSFLTSDTTYEGNDPLCSLAVNYLIADAEGQPLVVLIRENPANPTAHLRMLDALLDAAMPIVDIPERPSAKGLWADIARHLPKS